LVIFFEVLSARYATYALGLVLGLILCLAGFLFGSGFDLLVVMVILTYGSVFILLSLLLTQFSFLAGGAQRGTFQRFNPFWILAFGVIFCFFFLGGGVTSHPVAGSWALSVLWQDLVGMGGSDLSFVGLLVHELLYRFFFFETI
jgi:NADH:ubiquinone oxidoreductase subunit 6 (subunit J)